MEVFSLYCIIVLALLAQASSDPHFTSKPNKETTAFYGENVNFTWKYFFDHPLQRITFGLFSSIYDALEIHLVAIDKLSNGTLNVVMYKEGKAKPYDGRLKWVGDLTNRTVSFELSQIKYTDKTYFGVELEFNDTFDTMIEDSTKLLVKVPSTFESSPGTLSLLRGNNAEFSWKYHLNEEDKKTLTTVSFGVYRQNRFEELCKIEVKTGRPSCSGKRKPLPVVVYTQPKEKATFRLNEIRLDDEATYSIRLVGTQRPMENQSNLVVQVPAKFTKQPVQSLTVDEHKPLNISCTAQGKPIPTITWYKDDHVIQVNISGAYFVNNTRKKDAGKYFCVAENEVGNVTSSSTVVDVQYSPVINTTSKVVHAPIGRTVQFKCPALANPPAKIQWYRHNSLDSTFNGPVFKVFIRNKFDYGNYTCRASNVLGEDKASFVLEQVGPPLAPKVDCEKKAGESQSQWVVFRWKYPQDNGGDKVRAFTVKRRKIEGNNYRDWDNQNVSETQTWHRSQQEWETISEFTVTAWNIYGESKLDLDNSCIYTIGKDPALYNIDSTTMPTTEPTVVAAARNDSKDNENVMVYVGICIALLALIAVVVMLIVYRVKKNRSKKDTWNNHQNPSYDRVLSVESGSAWEEASANDKLLGSIPRSRAQTMVGSPSYQLDPEWNVPREKICIMKIIGNGAFGLVYKGRVHGVGPNTVGWNIVAIKSPYADATDAEVRDLMKEFELLKTLKPHPHVIKLLGCGEDEGRPLVIIEYVPFGDLLGYLRKSRGEDDDYYSDPEIKPTTNLSSQQLLRFAWHVTDGMTYLASEKIIHRDLAARNVLVGEGMSCKVTDFGMARDVSNDDIYLRTTEGRLPVKWTAIEALTGSGEYTTQSDVWSFGVVLYEICTIGADPYPGINGKEIPERLDSGYRMPRPGHVDPEIYEIMMSCWKTDPEERPTFPELKEKLVKLEAVQSRDYINLSECLYQNVTVNGAVKGTKRRSLLGLSKSSNKEPAKGNDYQEGLPGLHGHANVVTAV